MKRSGSPYRILMVLIAMLLGSSTVFAQKKTVKGVVLDSDSEPLIGATVMEKGTDNWTTTDNYGTFTLKVKSMDAVLQYSYVGMEDLEEALERRSSVIVYLEPIQSVLDESVVIGYGTMRAGDLTGSVATVSKAALEEKHIVNVEDALRGQIAGVRVISNNGAPGEALNIRVRGAGSINASNAPIYVIDGIVCENADVAPGDIENISILKDASATAIYGSKASNGVVIITTKRGEKGKLRITFDMNASYQQPTRLLDLMNTKDFVDMMQWSAYSFIPKGGSVNYGQSARKYYLDGEGNTYVFNSMSKWFNEQYTDPSNPDYVDSDWQKAMIRPVFVQDYRLSVSGGSDNAKFSAMGGFYDQPGLLIGSAYRRYSLRANVEVGLGRKGSKFGLNFSGNRSTQNGLATDGSGTTMNMLSQAPTKPLSAEDWSTEGNENKYENNNPLYQASHIKRLTSKTNTSLRIFFDLALAKNLTLKISGNFMNNRNQLETYYPSNVAQGRAEGGKAGNRMTNVFYWESENLLSWTPKFKNKDHGFDGMLGVTFEQHMQKILNTEAHGFGLEELNTSAMQDGAIPYSINTNYITNKMLSFFSRVNYRYKHIYFTGTIRFDGSSKFGANNRWGCFPSAALMWRASEEPFMKNADFISNLKLRASVGSTGNNSIPSLQSLATMSSTFYPVDGNTSDFGVTTDRPANGYLKWESQTLYNVGLDFGFFQNRLSGTIEAYYKLTSDLLIERPVPYSSGYSTQWCNMSSIANKGIEITLNAVPYSSKDFTQSFSYNMSFNRSKVLDLGGASEMILSPSSASRCVDFGILRVGLPLGNWYGYKSDGVFQSQAEIDALPAGYASVGVAKSSLQPGSPKFVDINGDGTINEADRVVLANALPKFTGGFSSTTTWRNFTLNINLEFAYGSKVFNATALELTQLNTNSAKNNLTSARNYWTPTLYDMTTGEIVHKGNESSRLHTPQQQWLPYLSNDFIEDASYLRLDNVSLGYNVPTIRIAGRDICAMTIYLAVRNACILTGYTGYDPDVSVADGIYSDLLPGLDAASFPRPRTYSLGLKLTF